MLLEPTNTQELLKELEKIKVAIGQVCRWTKVHVVGDDTFPPEMPKELGDAIYGASSSYEALKSMISAINVGETQLMYRIVAKCQRMKRFQKRNTTSAER